MIVIASQRPGYPSALVVPLLFNIYINDIARLSLREIYIYADDAAVVFPCAVYNDGAHTLQRDVRSMLHWFNDNNICINK